MYRGGEEVSKVNNF